MLQEIGLQPDFVRSNIDSMLKATRASLAAPPDTEHQQRIFMIGCGDSYCAEIAARSFVMEATGRMVEPVEALEFSRYLVKHIPSDAFVFGISNSGTVSRTIEGVALARERGAWTFAVTVSAANRLAQTAETLVKVNATPNIKERPDGTRVVTPGSVAYGKHDRVYIYIPLTTSTTPRYSVIFTHLTFSIWRVPPRPFDASSMRRSAISVWKAARATVPDLPDCPPAMSEPQWASLAFDQQCQVSEREQLLFPFTS